MVRYQHHSFTNYNPISEDQLQLWPGVYRNVPVAPPQPHRTKEGQNVFDSGCSEVCRRERIEEETYALVVSSVSGNSLCSSLRGRSARPQ